MDDKKEHIIYSQADIENYLQGNMSKEAMHSLERAALQDPFLADAIEGYTIVDTAVARKDLADIETMILAGKEPAKVVAITKKKNEWLKIAVAVLLVAGAGWIGMLLMNNGNQKAIVSNEEINIPEEKNTKIESDSVAPKADIASVEKKNTAQQYKSLDANSNAYDKLNGKTDDAGSTTTTRSYVTTEPAKIEVPIGSSSSVSANSNGTLSNQGFASNKAAGPSVLNNATNYNSSNSYTFSDVTKDTKSSLEDRKEMAFSETAKAKQEAKKPAKSMFSDNTTIVLPTIRIKRDSTVESIPVTGYFSKKEAPKPFTYKFSKEDSLTVPVNGWTAFNEYLRQNNAYTTITYDTAFTPVSLKNNKTGQEIVGLEFDIDNLGNPDKIKVTKSVDKETDAKAIDLLKKGPKWQTTDRKAKGKIAIKL